MSINYQIPTQSRYIPTSTVFSAVFNANPLNPGKYDFSYSAAGNADVEVLTLQQGTIYLIERISAGGNITEQEYLAAISTFPSLSIKRKIKKEMVYMRPIPINNYFDGQEAGCWIHSDKNRDVLTLTFDGVLDQTAALVGVATVRIQISLNIFAVDSAYFNGSFRDDQARSIGQSNRS